MLEGDPERQAQSQVVDAIQGRGVYHTCALLRRDKVRRDHVLRAALLGHRIRIDGLVVEVDQVLSLQALDDLERTDKDRCPGLGEDHELLALFDLHVVDVVVHGKGDVARQRPWRGGPGEDRRIRILLQPEADEDARIGNVVAISQRQLVARQRCSAPRAVRSDAETFVDEALLPHLAQRPPDRLDVLGGQRPVGVVVIEPEGHATAERNPLVDVAVHALAAEAVELLDSDLVFDVELA